MSTKGKYAAEPHVLPEEENVPEELDMSGETRGDPKKGESAPKPGLQKAPKGSSTPKEASKIQGKSAVTAKASKDAGAGKGAEVTKPEKADEAPVDLALYESNAKVDEPGDNAVDFKTYRDNAAVRESSKTTAHEEDRGGKPDVTAAGKTVPKEKDGKAQAEEDPKKTRARTAAEIQAEKEQTAARQRAQREADRETAAAKKRAEARAAAAANLKAYTQEQMAAIRREKVGDNAASVAPPQGSKTAYNFTDTGRRGPSQVCLHNHFKAELLIERVDHYLFIQVH